MKVCVMNGVQKTLYIQFLYANTKNKCRPVNHKIKHLNIKFQ